MASRGLLPLLFAAGADALAPRFLPPGQLLIGYATSRSLREGSADVAAADGVNVIIWSFAFLEQDEAGPRIRATFDLSEVLKAKARMAAAGQNVAHLVAFGGWNGAHPSTSLKGEGWFDLWAAWNAENGDVFDGIDWDLEGHDDAGAETSNLDPVVVEVVGEFSRSAKAAGFVVGMAPAQSYLDASSDEFDLALNHQPGAGWKPGTNGFPETFPYAGRNAYVALIRAAGGVETFDFISVQLYEGYSRACFDITVGGAAAAEVVANVCRKLSTEGVRISGEPASAAIVVPPNQLVVGFANGWADGRKFLSVAPRDIADAFAQLKGEGSEPRGVMFWVIDEEGSPASAPVHFARDVSSAMRPAPDL
ncbi:hypothetical protein M885DRAFT_614704 [Pelagophyceae sp. CCMP2097]|nr:hypothetical protein M885DRAFT_614704 [Pelagophyceae sp. CCMP2097]|mmetsp:Transcript_11116/g.39283  ORF Transcript_11116/g.39283 Transcript_11116/m.39283 type:complete len:364 (-) Transcript_11116:911-2002(-)